MTSNEMQVDVDPSSDQEEEEEEQTITGGLTIDDLEVSAPRIQSAPSAMLEQRKRMRAAAVPTDDAQVRKMLREMAHPITLFSERQPERRERLKFQIALKMGRVTVDGEKIVGVDGEDGEGDESEDVEGEEDGEHEEEGEKEEEFYTEGSDSLLKARQSIAVFSLRRAKRRIQRQRLEAKVPLARILALRKEVFEPIKHYTNLGSQLASDRPISMVRFSPNSKVLATGSWSGGVKLWDIPTANEIGIKRCHNEKVGGLSWHPRATIGQDSKAINLVTGAADDKVCLWSLDSDKPLRTLTGHQARVARTAFHPSGNYVGSASFDGTWRLWDCESGSELLNQEGHSREVYALEFQEDGALVGSGGLDALGRLWDTRTGRTAMLLHGHAREVLSIDFSPNGYQVATGSGDDTVRIWDMRKTSSLYTIPAHKSSVADVRFFRAENEGHKNKVFLDQERETTREDNEEKMDLDGEGEENSRLKMNGNINGGASSRENGKTQSQSQTQLGLERSGLYLATAGYDGFVRVWSADDWQLLRSLSGDAGKIMSVDISSDGQYLASGEWGRTFKLWGSL